ncbi:hypothetical protein [Thiohalophilus sp.]|uniref:hypothetical protein n=1 Tax=Thiohalophilus sp. TaxID=3028392 RepID=UPI002ACEE559|nr:hypothetical protein [Thiohalophilus sp.]MDZ7802741.1 hypothetical protein [Thiohalophilus sp.]
MEAEALYALRDPAGIPFYPVVFMILGVLTFAMHIFAVQLMLGATGMTLFGSFAGHDHWRRLSGAMLDVAKISVSVAIVLGVAPLLFVQVTYDPFWYTSNVLSASWVIGFVVILIVGYWSMYLYYFRNKGREPGSIPRSRWAMAVSLALLLVVGFIMHVLTVQMLYPEQWMQWYAPQDRLDTSGSGLYAFNLLRFLFFISFAVPVVGSWLVAYRRYFSVRQDVDREYLEWVGQLGGRLMQFGMVVTLILGILWMTSLPDKVADFATSPWVWISALALVGLLGIGALIRRQLHAWGYWAIGLTAVAGLVVAVSREALRWVNLKGVHGYNILDYKVNMDWYSTILFFATFAIVGGSVLAYLITVAWRAGQTEGVYTPGPVVRRMGAISAGLIVLWIVQYFVVGFVVWAR